LKPGQSFAKAMLSSRALLDEAVATKDIALNAGPDERWMFIIASVPLRQRGKRYDLIVAWALLPTPEAVM
jgi:hypothetical protein